MARLWVYMVAVLVLLMILSPCCRAQTDKADHTLPLLQKVLEDIYTSNPSDLRNMAAPRLRVALTDSTFKQVRSAMIARGSVVRVDVTSEKQEPDATTAQFVVHMQRGTLVGVILFGPDDRIGGLVFKPAVGGRRSRSTMNIIVIILVMVVGVTCEVFRRKKRQAAS